MAERPDLDARNSRPAESISPKRSQPEIGGPSRKRLRYVAQACDQCKRQKVRCNGRTPCNRCEKLRPRECRYQGDHHVYYCQECGGSDGGGTSAQGDRNSAPKPDKCSSSDSSCKNEALLPSLLEKIEAQAEKLDLLVERTRILDTHVTLGRSCLFLPNSAPSLDYHDSKKEPRAWEPLIPTTILHPEPRRLPPFHGPTSSSFLIGLANLWLDQGDRNIICAQIDPDLVDYEILSTLDDEVSEVEDVCQEEYTEALHPLHQRPESPTLTKAGRKLSLDPLQKLNSDEAIQLIRQYDDLIGARYPFIDTEVLIQQTRELYVLLQTAASTDLVSINALAISMGITNIHILKMVLAIVLVSEGTARRNLGYALFKSLQHTVLGKMLGRTTNVKDLALVILVGLYYFYTDKLQTACRLSSTMVRLSLELGLHRSSTFSRPNFDDQNLVKAVNVFWSIYVLDRQWSFASGLPISLQDTDIDPDLSEPDNTPFLKLMIRYARIGDQAWNSLSRSLRGRLGGSRTTHDFRTANESLEFHEYQLDQWERSIPEELKFSHADHTDARTTFLRTVLRLRANQLRILMIRPLLYSSPSSASQLEKCLAAMDVASDTIQIIADLHARSDMYLRQQALFNHFMVSALGLLYVLIIRDTVKEPLSSTTGDRLPPDSLAKAYTRLFRGLDVLGSLDASTTTPRSLCNKLFSITSRLKKLRSQNDYSDRIVDYSSRPSLRFPAMYTRNTSLQDPYHNLSIDPALMATDSSTADTSSQSITQGVPGSCYDIMNMLEPGGASIEDASFQEKEYGHQFMTSSNESTSAASFSELEAAYFDNIGFGTMQWQNLEN